MIRHPDYTRARLERFSAELRALIWPERRPVDSLAVAGPVDRISHAEAQTLEYRQAELGERFGPLWATYWFRAAAKVPPGWKGHRVDLQWFSDSEATLWLQGVPAQGLNKEHREAVLVRDAKGGEQLAFEVELACNGLFGRQRDRPFELHRCELARFDPGAWTLYHDFETLRLLAIDPGLDEAWAGELLSELNRYCNEEDPTILAGLYERRNASTTHELSAVGHAHLDTAWLWPLAETHRKAVRTFSTQVGYMDEYEDYRFACSQAQQYAWIEAEAPELWQRICEKVDAGQFVPVGGTWIEPDCNIPSGESLVRQFLQGQRYFEQRFGRRCSEFWNPDVFGYNGQLPQLMREAGITRFLTQKLSWNRFNPPQHQTFTWQGVDGSEVIAHFPPADTYNAEASVPELRRSAREYKDHAHSRRSLLVFGHGDGGGGPTRTMIETLRRARDLQGLPRTQIVAPETFFDELEAEPNARPVVVGELYFEYHRGTYTTQARTKRGNRRAELALHDAEFMVAAAGGEYPREELTRLWRLLLLQQFHDILPGSSIGLVYEDAERDLAEVIAGADSLWEHGDVPVNTSGVMRREVLDGRIFVKAPPYGAALETEHWDEVDLVGLVLENMYLRAELSPDGTVLSLVHKQSGRETLAEPGNRLELYDDRPVEFDAWDVDPFHLETRRDCVPAESCRVLTESKLRVEVEFDRAIGERSRLTQVVRLDAGSQRLEFHTTVDWHEEHKLLKTCFPLDVRAPNATYEMQFGYAERPTHYSTSFDAARYEVPGHRWADLSEWGFGAALLSDCKYGYSCYGNELRMSLLRSPKSPDEEADMGRHEFAYALFPHWGGGWRHGGVVAESIRFTMPFRWAADPPAAFVQTTGDNLILDTVKRAEDSDALVLRFYEAYGGRGTAFVDVNLGSAVRAVRANLLEDDGDPLDIVDGEIVIPYRPHEIITVKVW